MSSTQYLDTVINKYHYALVVHKVRYGSGIYAVLGHTTENAEAISSSFTDGDDDWNIVDSFYGYDNPISLYSTGNTLEECIKELNEKCRRILAIEFGFDHWQDIHCYVREEYEAACKSRKWEDRDFSPELKAKLDEFKAMMDAVPNIQE